LDDKSFSKLYEAGYGLAIKPSLRMSIDGTRTLSCGEVSVDPEVNTRKSNKCGDRSMLKKERKTNKGEKERKNQAEANSSRDSRGYSLV
jgi:hypothetical protein